MTGNRAEPPDPRPAAPSDSIPHSSHWGSYLVRSGQSGGIQVDAMPFDPDPSPLLGNIARSAHHPARVTSPAIRAGWLRHGPGADDARGADEFVRVEWDELEQRLAAELDRVYRLFGPDAVYGGSYGWASAGRFHHAQSQLHRFLNVLGGYVAARNNYSTGASSVVMRHVLGPDVDAVHGLTNWEMICRHIEMVLAFGGIPIKNSSVAPGGLSDHGVRQHIDRARRRGVEFVSISPLRDDLAGAAQWLPIRPGTDCALMLGLLHTLIRRGWADRDFLRRYCSGFDRFEEYVLGQADGVPKTSVCPAGDSASGTGRWATSAGTGWQ